MAVPTQKSVEWYTPAWVFDELGLSAYKGRFGFAYRVVFDNPEYNVNPRDSNDVVVHADDKDRLSKLTKRALMPVNRSGAVQWTEEKDVHRATDRAANTFALFLRAAVTGDAEKTRALCLIDADACDGSQASAPKGG